MKTMMHIYLRKGIHTYGSDATWCGRVVPTHAVSNLCGDLSQIEICESCAEAVETGKLPALVDSKTKKPKKFLVSFNDYSGVPRAWAVAPTAVEAETEARQQLATYCAKQKTYGEIDLADPARYTINVLTVPA